MTIENPDHLVAPASAQIVVAPATGRVVPLGDIPDPAFSAGALGRGAGIEPSDGEIVAPIDGEVVAVMPHAYGIRGGGLEVLVHIGIDTVELNGRHFSSHVAMGDLVQAGARLATADVPAIAAAGYATVVVVVLTNSEELGDVAPLPPAEVSAGAPFLSVTV